MNGESLYAGKKLSEYSKEELINIIDELGTLVENLRNQHERDLDNLMRF